MENYSLLMGAAVMKMAVEMAAVSMEKPGSTSPSGGVRTETLSPDLGFAMARLWKERDEPHSYRYNPEPRWRTTPSSWAAAVMKMVVEMAAVSMEKPSGGTSPAACRNRDSCPPDLGFAMAAALEGFAYRGLFVSGF
ncbi:hypothetical protein QYE76_024446 [Lolium multiflorum]|uniref:Uncharacterized protein n=1 Tax=Lolium multiflorum TaxID=4521 RepID=A0AAD8RG79_LOLMU|nr:hypothetical protein QYE76_024446 [Lolium multiflorum]